MTSTKLEQIEKRAIEEAKGLSLKKIKDRDVSMIWLFNECEIAFEKVNIYIITSTIDVII